MALAAIRPLAVDFVDTILSAPGEGGVRVTEIQVAQDSPLVNATIEQGCSSGGIQVLVLKRRDGQIVVSPSGDVVVQRGDGLIVVGAGPQLELLEGKKQG